MSSEERPIEFVKRKEEDKISRKLLGWINTFPEIPVSIELINYEYMPVDAVGMALSTIQGTYIIERNIIGGYLAEYQFKIIYRVKPGKTPDARLKADELLDRLGDWMSGQKPDIGEELLVEELEQATRSSLFAELNGGWEDHQIFIRMTYQVKAR